MISIIFKASVDDYSILINKLYDLLLFKIVNNYWKLDHAIVSTVLMFVLIYLFHYIISIRTFSNIDSGLEEILFISVKRIFFIIITFKPLIWCYNFAQLLWNLRLNPYIHMEVSVPSTCSTWLMEHHYKSH